MARLNVLLTGYEITDYLFERTSSTALALDHDTIRGTADLEIWTGAGGTGTQLALTTDYTVSDEDTDLSTEAGVSIYTKLAIVNGTYHNVDLYATYKTIGDYASVASVEAASGAVGDVKMIAYATPDDGWLLCNGQAVSRSSYATLFAKIGAVWGVGDGSTTFNVPDMREAAPVGVGTFSAVTGTTRGTQVAADVYDLAEFKDDQEQKHLHVDATNAATTGVVYGYLSDDTGLRWNQTSGTASAANGSKTSIQKEAPSGGTPRTGTTTRGKRIGLNFVIKY